MDGYNGQFTVKIQCWRLQREDHADIFRDGRDVYKSPEETHGCSNSIAIGMYATYLLSCEYMRTFRVYPTHTLYNASGYIWLKKKKTIFQAVVSLLFRN